MKRGEFDWRLGVTVKEAAARHGVRTQRVHYWVRTGRLPFAKLPGGRGGNGWLLLVDADRAAELAAAARVKVAKWAGHTPKADRSGTRRDRSLKTIDGGRGVYLNDPIADVARSPGAELTAADRAVLAERRERFEQRRLSCSSR
jgi:hypothetical protein